MVYSFCLERVCTFWAKFKIRIFNDIATFAALPGDLKFSSALGTKGELRVSNKEATIRTLYANKGGCFLFCLCRGLL